MDRLLLGIRLRRKRDVFEARQRARQIAALLGFDAQDQAVIAAGVFALAWQSLRQETGVRLFFEVKRRVLHVFLSRKRSGANCGPARLAKRLPAKTPFAEDDVKWMIRELVRQPAPGLFEEMAKLNQELLDALLAARQGMPAQADAVARWNAARDKTA
jgi:hypothetical protein